MGSTLSENFIDIYQSRLRTKLHHQPLTSNGPHRDRLRSICKVPRFLLIVDRLLVSNNILRTGHLLVNSNTRRMGRLLVNSNILRVVPLLVLSSSTPKAVHLPVHNNSILKVVQLPRNSNTLQEINLHACQ